MGKAKPVGLAKQIVLDGEFSVRLIPGLQGLLWPVGKDDVLRAAVNTLLQYISERLGARVDFVADRESKRQETRFNSCFVL